MQLYIEQLPTEGRLLLAGDHTAWPRPEAVTLKDRTIEHQPTQIAGNKPIAVGGTLKKKCPAVNQPLVTPTDILNTRLGTFFRGTF